MDGAAATFKALSVVVGEMKNREVLEELREYRKTHEAIKQYIPPMLELYLALVWTARHANADLALVSKSVAPGDLEHFYDEAEALSGDNGDWKHGFNSGCLATLRLVMDLLDAEDTALRFNEQDDGIYASDDDEPRCTAESLREQAVENFPALDT